ncbi:MAG: hypothetical protein ACK4I8_07935, partial [Armatimonadota bacterium]
EAVIVVFSAMVISCHPLSLTSSFARCHNTREQLTAKGYKLWQQPDCNFPAVNWLFRGGGERNDDRDKSRQNR